MGKGEFVRLSRRGYNVNEGLQYFVFLLTNY